MVVNRSDSAPPGEPGPQGQPRLGPALRRAWVGYQQRLDEELAAAGFADRAFPDGRVLRMCAEPGGMTVSQVGRQLGITRQGAAKVVANLRERGYVETADSATDGREKIVTLSRRAVEYLTAHRKAVRSIEGKLRKDLGEEGLAALYRLLDALGAEEDLSMSAYLRTMRHRLGRMADPLA